ncbi:ABC transporter substrate-binding protein [Roseateles sp. BYS78W]|uniref:ABC transporter substrate-binding protein n=1 Tax=Pelomonas candidula TaxID=3299025 RepID=A0ABW7HCW3_9BURK
MDAQLDPTGRRDLLRWLLASVPAAAHLDAWAGPPSNYPDSYPVIAAAARDEGKVVVYSTTDLSAVAALIRDFEQCYPGIRVEYNDLNSAELHQRYLAEAYAGKPTADVLWSSAMDLQMKLANDDYATRYRSPEIASLPDWAVWRETAYGTTFEPAVFVYNKHFVSGDEVPATHADVVRLLTSQRGKYAGNVTTYDIEKSAVGFLFATQDSRIQASFWELVRAMGADAVELEANTSVMVQRIAAGKVYLGYNLIGSYALTRARRDPSIGVVLPRDYTLVMSRIALITKSAANPNAARLWLDYLLSKRGQTVLSGKSELFSIREDVPGEYTAATLRRELGGRLKAIAVAPPLLVFLDRVKQQEFLRRWRRETGDAK